MVYLHTNLGIFWRALEWKMLFWNIFGNLVFHCPCAGTLGVHRCLVFGPGVSFAIIWCIFPVLVHMLNQGKSGNPSSYFHIVFRVLEC
jgi:hypothetical protein